MVKFFNNTEYFFLKELGIYYYTILNILIHVRI